MVGKQKGVDSLKHHSIMVGMSPKKKRAESREGMVVTTIALDSELHQDLAIAAIQERAALTELVRVAVREWLERRKRKTSTRGGKS